MGRLTRDPEVRTANTASGSMNIARFTLAVDRKFRKGKEAETDFFECTSFGKQSDFVSNYLKKGSKVLVSGRIQNNNYTNKDGQKVFSVQVCVDEIEFAESKTAGESSRKPETENKPKVSDEFVNVPDSLSDEELPFD